MQKKDFSGLAGEHLASRGTPKRRDGILLLGNYRPALIAARKLHGLGYHVTLGTGGGEGWEEYSRE